MADGVKISSLTEATDAQMTDAGLIEAAVADTGSSTGFSSKKASLSRFAGYILNKFSGLSLAGASQTVKSAIDKVFTNSYMDIGTTIESATNLNTLTTVGKYSARTTTVSSLLNCPTTTGFSMYVEVFTTSGKKQTIIDNNGATYTRINISNNTTSWTDWAKQPTRAEIDSLNSNFVSISGSDKSILDTVKALVVADNKVGYFLATATVSDVPTTEGAWFVHYVRNDGSNIVHVRASRHNAPNITYRTYISNYQSSTSFSGGWTQEPTRAEIGSLSSLTTTAKTSLVDAINEVNTAINSLVDGNEVSY